VKKALIMKMKQRHDISTACKNHGVSSQTFWNAMGRTDEKYTDKRYARSRKSGTKGAVTGERY
jgi:hypothetical protein